MMSAIMTRSECVRLSHLLHWAYRFECAQGKSDRGTGEAPVPADEEDTGNEEGGVNEDREEDYMEKPQGTEVRQPDPAPQKEGEEEPQPGDVDEEPDEEVQPLDNATGEKIFFCCAVSLYS